MFESLREGEMQSLLKQSAKPPDALCWEVSGSKQHLRALELQLGCHTLSPGGPDLQKDRQTVAPKTKHEAIRPAPSSALEMTVCGGHTSLEEGVKKMLWSAEEFSKNQSFQRPETSKTKD